jgi:hypothetical protein
MDRTYLVLGFAILVLIATSGCFGQEWTGFVGLPPENEIQPPIKDAVKVAEAVPEEARKLLPGFAEEMAKLPEIDPSSLDSYEGFKGSLDGVNDLIRILNREGGLDLQALEVDVETYRKYSRIATEYGPLINNYNEVVTTAKAFEEGNPKKEQAFYMAIGKFSVEAFLIVSMAYYGVAYKTTGFLYRASGLNKLAFSHPTFISIITSSTHWTIRNGLVELSSEFAEIAVEEGQDLIESPEEKIEEIKENAETTWNDSTTWIRDQIEEITDKQT